jgi:hypothetical protein
MKGLLTATINALSHLLTTTYRSSLGLMCLSLGKKKEVGTPHRLVKRKICVFECKFYKAGTYEISSVLVLWNCYEPELVLVLWNCHDSELVLVLELKAALSWVVPV